MNRIITIAIVVVLLAGLGAGYFFTTNLQSQDALLQQEIAALNVALDQVENKQTEEFAKMDKRLDQLEDDDDGDDDDHDDDDKK